MRTYRDCLFDAITLMGQHPQTCVLGYNTSRIGGFGGGMFASFPEDRIHEMPLAEASMMGAAIGMALDGWVPLLWLERFDFMLNCMDAIVNHLDKLTLLSQGIHKPGVIINVAVGNKRVPLFTGPTHTQDFSVALRQMVEMPVHNLHWGSSIIQSYETALTEALAGKPSIMVHYRDQMNEPYKPE